MVVMNDVQEWGLQFIYPDDSLDCRFRIMGILTNISDEADEDFVPHYRDIVVVAGNNTLLIAVPEHIIEVILETQEDTPFGDTIIVDGVLSNGIQPIKNLVLGSMFSVKKGLLFADGIQLLGELEIIDIDETDLDADNENLL